jgi:hypothetical protein
MNFEIRHFVTWYNLRPEKNVTSFPVVQIQGGPEVKEFLENAYPKIGQFLNRV